MSTNLGDNQRGTLRSLAGGYRTGPRRTPYPEGGWIWDTDSGTRRILDSLVNRGLARREGDPRRGKYHLTAAGARELGITPTADELLHEETTIQAEQRIARQETAYRAGHLAAMADAQACKSGANGTTSWRGREHKVPQDADERAAWMRGYGLQFAYWGGYSPAEDLDGTGMPR